MIKLVFVAGPDRLSHRLPRAARAPACAAAPLPEPLALRLFNEAALLLVVPIILLAVVKPF